MRFIFVGIIFPILFGCSNGPLLGYQPYTKEPLHLGRLLDIGLGGSGQRSVLKAINTCKEINDTECLARQYLYYGIFLRHDMVTRNKESFEKRGFKDKTVTYANRYQKSVDYIQKAFALNSKSEPYRACIEKLVREKPLIYDVEFGMDIAITADCNIE